MDFVWGALKVIVGGFLLFTIARVTYGRLVPRAGWAWVALVGVLAIGNMLVHKAIGSSINPPFFTAVLFAMSLMGLAPDNSIVARIRCLADPAGTSVAPSQLPSAQQLAGWHMRPFLTSERSNNSFKPNPLRGSA